MKSSFSLFAGSLLFCIPATAAETYDARTAERQILTPAPPVAPRINGPVVCGARPGNPFLCRIPTQGERPIRFEVRGFPDGLKLDAEKGLITGKTPKRKGEHSMSITAKNSHGHSNRSFKIVVGDKLALTPPTSWNSWGGQMLNVSDAVMRKATDTNFWTSMSNCLRSQNRDIIFNLCQYGLDAPWTWAPGLGIQSCRMGGDLNHKVENYFINALRIATELRAYNKPGQWNDPDFMYINRIKDVAKMGEPSVEIKLNTNQRYQYVTLWLIVCAPFFFSCDIEHIDEFTVRLLGNADVLNINQDELGHASEVIRNDDHKETVMLKKLADGSKALAVFNRDARNDAVITVNWQDIGGGSDAEGFDVWRQKALGKLKGGISVQLAPNGVGLFLVKGSDCPEEISSLFAHAAPPSVFPVNPGFAFAPTVLTVRCAIIIKTVAAYAGGPDVLLIHTRLHMRALAAPPMDLGRIVPRKTNIVSARVETPIASRVENKNSGLRQPKVVIAPDAQVRESRQSSTS